MQHFIGCDVHTRYQVVRGSKGDRERSSSAGWSTRRRKCEVFTRSLPQGTVVGIEATFPAHWFERLMGELGHELWVGDAARIRASEVR